MNIEALVLIQTNHLQGIIQFPISFNILRAKFF